MGVYIRGEDKISGNNEFIDCGTYINRVFVYGTAEK